MTFALQTRYLRRAADDQAIRGDKSVKTANLLGRRVHNKLRKTLWSDIPNKSLVIAFPEVGVGNIKVPVFSLMWGIVS